MELNKKIIRVGLILIALVLIVSIATTLIYRVDNPVFLKMYVEHRISDNTNSSLLENLRLMYITNVGDNRRIRSIEFEGIEDIGVYINNYNNNPWSFNGFDSAQSVEHDGYGRYRVNTIYINMDFHSIDKSFEEIELNRAKISFDDGSTLDTDLGRIIIYNHDDNPDYIRHNSSSGSSDGTSSLRGTIEKDISLIEVKSKLLDDMADHITLTIDDVDYRDISGKTYKANQSITIESQFITPSNIADRLVIYDIRPKLYYKDKDGNITFERIHNIDYRPYHFSGTDVFKYLRLRGEI